MKKLLLGLIAVGFISLSSFTTIDSKEILVHNCTYDMYNKSGEYLGTITLYDVPDNISCSSDQAKKVAIDYWNSIVSTLKG